MRNLSLLIIVLFPFTLLAQEKVTRFQTLPKFSEPGKFTVATKLQLGVMGSDFNRDKFIGMAPVELISDFNTHYPIDGFKRTMCGTMVSYYIRTQGRLDKDDDVHFNIRPEFGSAFLINEHNLKIRDINLVRAKNDKDLRNFVSRISSPDIFSEQGINAYNEIIRSLNILKPLTPHFLRDMQKEVFGEVDLVDHKSIPEYSPNLPRQELSCACTFGAWVNDRAAIPFGAYHDFVEIHPVEQVWWTYQKNSNETEYFLGAFGDATNKFYTKDHYDTDGGKLSFSGPWITCPGNQFFAIPFEIKNRMPTLTFTAEKIINQISKNRLSPLQTHTLIFKNDTLVRLTEQDGLSIRYDKVGIDRIVGLDTFIKGFVVIGNLTANTKCPEMVFTKITANKNIKRIKPPTGFNQPPIVKVTLKNIECRSVDDDDDDEEIIGYSGVIAYNARNLIFKEVIRPFDNPENLLFSRRDGHPVKLRKGGTLTLNTVRSFELDDNATVEIKSDLDEDDTNGDDNDDDLDNDDDRLADGGSVKTTVFFVKTMLFNKAIPVTHVFKSGGTEVALNFEVIKIGQDPNKKD